MPSARSPCREQDFAESRAAPSRRSAAAAGSPRAAVFFGAALMTAAFAHELYGVLSFVQVTPIQLLFLVLSTISFGWIALGTLSAAHGLPAAVRRREGRHHRYPDAPTVRSAQRTALLFPVHHEDPARIAGTIAAIAEELEALGKTTAFDVFVLSDTRGAEAGAAEEAAYAELTRALAGQIERLLPPPHREHRPQGRQHQGLGRALRRRLRALRHPRRRQHHVGRDARAPRAGHGGRRRRRASSRPCRSSPAA